MPILSKQEQHRQCLREIRGTLAVTALCAAWHVGSAFALDGTDWRFLGMPAWFSVSVLGTIVILLAGLWYLLKRVFVDFDYEPEASEPEEGGRR